MGGHGGRLVGATCPGFLAEHAGGRGSASSARGQSGESSPTRRPCERRAPLTGGSCGRMSPCDSCAERGAGNVSGRLCGSSKQVQPAKEKEFDFSEKDF
jgi:hypothetical protein